MTERLFDAQLTTVSVESLQNTHDAVVVSAVRQYGNLGPFRPVDRSNFKGIRIFDILLRPEQILCCSAVVPGDMSSNLYGRWGVVVAKGDIETAFPYDAMTSIVDGCVESQFTKRLIGTPIDEQIASALYARGDYNEINARARQIAGLYYCLDKDEDPDELELPSPNTQELLNVLNVPSFLLRNGQFYLFNPLESLDVISEENRVKPSDMPNFAVNINDEMRNKMIDLLVSELTLAPRNAITSGVQRGQFAYEYRSTSTEGLRSFVIDHQRLIESDREGSLRTYGAIALFAFAEAARDLHQAISSDAELIASDVMSRLAYEGLVARITKNGNLKINREDFDYYLNTGQLPRYIDDHWM